MNNMTMPIIGYDVVDLPLPQLSGLSIVSKAVVQNLALSLTQNIASWAGQDYTGYIHACVTRCGEPVYEKDDLNVEWVTYDVWSMSSPIAGVNSGWLTDDTKSSDYVEVRCSYDACSGQFLKSEAFPPYSTNNGNSVHKSPLWTEITKVRVNGKETSMHVPPVLSKGRCYVHQKYMQALADKSVKPKAVYIGAAKYVAVADLCAHSGTKASYDAKLNKLDITTTPAVKKAK
ncbi:MAG: hypothetical protein ACYC1M_18230 [Armatimonadota bacterium]